MAKKGRGGKTGGAGKKSGTSSGSSSGGSSSGSSSSGSSSGGGGSSGGSSSGSAGGSGGSSGGGQGGARASRSSPSPSSASSTSGSSSTTTGSNVQSVAVTSTPNYSSIYSANPLTQGANRAQVTDVQSVSLQARSLSPTVNADPTTLGKQISASSYNVQYTNAHPNQYPMMVEKYGVEVANKLATQTYYTRQQVNAMHPATNTDNQYLQSENRALNNAERRQAEFVNQNQFLANPQPNAYSEKPDKIYTSTNLYQQAGQDDNPLSILEGNPFIAPSHQYFEQVNEQFAPRPVYSAFTTNPYIGVHVNSPLSPNSDLDTNQRKGATDYLSDVRNHRYFPLLIAGVIVVVIITILKGRGRS